MALQGLQSHANFEVFVVGDKAVSATCKDVLHKLTPFSIFGYISKFVHICDFLGKVEDVGPHSTVQIPPGVFGRPSHRHKFSSLVNHSEFSWLNALDFQALASTNTAAMLGLAPGVLEGT